MRRTTCASFIVVLGLASLTIRPSFAAKGILSVVAQPSVVALNVPTAVRIEANVSIDADLLRDSVTLLKVTANGAVLATLGQLNDNGIGGDRVAFDNVFSTVLMFNTNTPAWMYIQVTAAYRNTLQRFKSTIIPITINTLAYTGPLNPTTLASDDNGVYPANEILVGLTEGANRSLAETVAGSLGGTVVGFIPSINAFQIQIQSQTPAGTTAALQQALSLPNVAFAMRDVIGGTFSVSNDMTALQASQPTAVGAYDKVHAFDAWNRLASMAGTFSPVTIGIIEPGTPAFNHPEFTGVNFGSSPLSPGVLSTPENNDHATAVGGIIGANNRTAFEVPAPSQMNGILAGLTSSATPAGSAIPYTLEFRSYSRISDLAAAVDSLDAAGARVINMSVGWYNRAALPATLAYAPLVLPADSFLTCTTVMRAVFAHHPGILFVLGAGNYAVSSDGSCLPNAGGGLDNVMTVAATDLNDARSVWNLRPQALVLSSTYGPGISIAAPGGRCKATDSYQPDGTCNCTEGVYAPASIGYWQMASGSAFAGTSAAAPLVSGAAGVLVSIAPGLGPGTLKSILEAGADRIVDQSISGTRLNVDGAVQKVLASYPLDSSVVGVTATSNGAPWPSSGQMAINYRIVCNAQTTGGTLVPWFLPFVPSGTCTLTYLSGGPSQMVLGQIQPCAAVFPMPAQLSCTAIIPARNTVNFTFVFAPVTGGPLNQTDGSVVGSETGYTWGAQVSWGQYGSTPVPTGFTFSQVDVFMDCGSGTSTFELYIYDPNNGSAYLDQHQTVPCLGGIPHDIGFSFSPITINDGKLVLSVQTFNAGGVYVGGTNSQPFANFYDGINPQYGNYFNGSIPQWPKILFNRVPPPAVLVNATFNGNVWPASGTGSVGYSLQGPSGTVSGTGSVPFGASNLQPGSYTLTYNGGGPANGTMTGILPCGLLTRGSSCTANLNAGQTLPFTLQFTWLGQTDGSVIATYNSSRIADDWKEIGLDLSVPANTTITKATFYASANCSGSRTYRVIFVDSNWGTIQDNYFTAPCGGTTPQQVDYTLPTPLTWSGDLKVIFQIQGLAGYNMYFAGSNTGTYRDMWCNDWSCGFFPRFSLSVYGR